MITDNGKTLKFNRALKVDVATLFNAWASPETFKAWWKGLDVVEVDFKKGGAYRLTWKNNPGHYVKGNYTEIIPNQLIQFTWITPGCGASDTSIKTSTVTLKFAAAGEKESHLEMTHEFLGTEDMLDAHHEGWTAALANLDRHFNEVKRPVVPGLAAEVSRTLPFPVEKVYQAWTNVEMLGKWFNRRDATLGKSGGTVEVGKSSFMDFHHERGHVSRVYSKYLEIIPLKKISFIWSSAPCLDEYDINMQAESRVTVEFKSEGTFTKVSIVHDQLTSSSSMEMYFEGWTDCLASIEDRITRKVI